ncbi:VWA domain-containing protein [Streptomyces sp. NPDC005752]|uniref:vWA domain-containing protein n=1 Tax=Streptomyces sp. NPDC005752 TaxID=3157065 RepID=UPI00341088BA
MSAGSRAGTRSRRARAAVCVGGALFALLAGVLPAVASVPAAPGAAGRDAPGGGSLVMVLDSSGSMSDDDGTGRTRMETARTAVGTVVDALPDGHPTGLRVYGADRARGCTDTRLVRPVGSLDRAAMKQAVAGVQPRGDTPIGLSLRKAAEDLPAPSDGAVGTRTILLISDGEANCGTPNPCEVAERLGRQGDGLRIDTVGFQVEGAAREQLECVAEAGNGRYYDAPDADALARQLQRSAQLSVDGYRLKGERVEGAATAAKAPAMAPGQYLDTIGPGEKRYYAVNLDAASAADFAATAVPQPGAAVDSLDALSTGLAYGDGGTTCESDTARFLQQEGAAPLTSAVSRIRSEGGNRSCDEAGRYWLVVERQSKAGSDSARWPLELLYGVETPLSDKVTPAQSRPEYGRGGKDAALPTGDPHDVRGGTGFNDATELGGGVWRDRILPSQTLWYKVPTGWGQQVRYDVEFANEPTVDGLAAYSYGGTQLFTPARCPVGGGGEFRSVTKYSGRPAALRMGSVPVAWTNRYESPSAVRPVRAGGDFYIAVTLGAKAAEIAENPRIGVVLRVAVLGEELSGPEHGAPALEEGPSGTEAGKDGDTEGAADSGGPGGAGWTGIAAAGAGAVAVLTAGILLVRRRRRTGTQTTRGSA